MLNVSQDFEEYFTGKKRHLFAWRAHFFWCSSSQLNKSWGRKWGQCWCRKSANKVFPIDQVNKAQYFSFMRLGIYRVPIFHFPKTVKDSSRGAGCYMSRNPSFWCRGWCRRRCRRWCRCGVVRSHFTNYRVKNQLKENIQPSSINSLKDTQSSWKLEAYEENDIVEASRQTTVKTKRNAESKKVIQTRKVDAGSFKTTLNIVKWKKSADEDIVSLF